MVDVRSLVEGVADAVARATEPITKVATETAGAGANAAAQGMQVTEAVASALAGVLWTLPGRLKELELPSAKQRLEDMADQLKKIGGRMNRLSHHLGQAAKHLGEPALQGSGKMIADGFAAAASGVDLFRLSETGPIRFVPRSVSRPYLDSVGTILVGLRAAGDLSRMFAESLPAISEALGDIAEDLGRSGELLEATSNTLRELSELSPI